MDCTNCLTIKDLPLCADKVNFGTIPVQNTAVLIRLQGIDTGRVILDEATSGAAGEILLDLKTLVTGGVVSANEVYRIDVVKDLKDTTGYDITLKDGTTVSKCYLVEFVDTYSEGNVSLAEVYAEA